MKKFLLLMAAAMIAPACAQNPSGPSGSTSPVASSANSTLPTWMFAYNGHLVRPKPGTYSVYAASEIMAKPELRQHLELVLSAAADLSGGQVRFVLTSDAKAPITFRIDANDPQVAPGVNLGYGEFHPQTDFWSHDISIVIRDEDWFKSNVPLHELGHFIFGPGHSDTSGDIMSLSRDYHRMSFSDHEKALWNQSLAFAPGTMF